ncbi:MAG: HK97-fold major capsid protein [Candidatus Pacearchaeota archaeon]
MPRTITAAQKNQLMTKLLGSTQGRKKIAASIQEPLRKLRDYVSIGRKALWIDELPDGALPIYDRDVATPAYVVGDEGDTIQALPTEGPRIMVPLFELAAYPKIPFAHVKERRFDVIRRIKQKAKDELFRKEDTIIFEMLKVAGTSNIDNPSIAVAAADFNMSTIVDAFAGIEKWGLRVDKVFMNPQEFKVFRNAGRDYVDFETQRELLRTGFMGQVYGAGIYMSMQVPRGTLFFVAEPEYLGVMPVRIDLTVIPADVPGDRMFGWSIFENIGMTVHNSYGIQQVVVS